jgi:hypothetical protein
MSAELRTLFHQFTEAASTDTRISDQFTAWAQARRQWRSLWASRNDVPERTLQHFVPAPASAGQAHWSHPIAEEASEIETWRSHWKTATPAELSELAAAFVRAVEQVEGDPASTVEACSALTRAAGRRGLPLAAVTPALSALDPHRFAAICNAWLRPLREYEGAPLPGEIAEYDHVNGVAFRWLGTAEGDKPPAMFASYPPADRFGVFCGWVARKSSEQAHARFDVTQKKYKDWPPMW